MEQFTLRVDDQGRVLAKFFALEIPAGFGIQESGVRSQKCNGGGVFTGRQSATLPERGTDRSDENATASMGGGSFRRRLAGPRRRPRFRRRRLHGQDRRRPPCAPPPS